MSMNILIEKVEKEIQEELKRANEKFPLFHSDHEALAVIEEEVHEAHIEHIDLNIVFEHFKEAVFNDNADNEHLNDIKYHALQGACELIQVAAMADKFILSKNEREKNK